MSPFGGGYDIPRIDILSRDLVHDIMPRAVEALAAQEALPVHQRVFFYCKFCCLYLIYIRSLTMNISRITTC